MIPAAKDVPCQFPARASVSALGIGVGDASKPMIPQATVPLLRCSRIHISASAWLREAPDVLRKSAALGVEAWGIRLWQLSSGRDFQVSNCSGPDGLAFQQSVAMGPVWGSLLEVYMLGGRISVLGASNSRILVCPGLCRVCHFLHWPRRQTPFIVWGMKQLCSP